MSRRLPKLRAGLAGLLLLLGGVLLAPLGTELHERLKQDGRVDPMTLGLLLLAAGAIVFVAGRLKGEAGRRPDSARRLLDRATLIAKIQERTETMRSSGPMGTTVSMSSQSPSRRWP